MMDGASSGNLNGILIFVILIIGFIAVTLMMQLVGKNFHWHEELD
jgi:hypothetical protein